MESNAEETELGEWRDQEISSAQSSVLERQAQMRRVGKEEGEREGLKVLKMAHLSLQLSLYQFTKGRYGKRHPKSSIKAFIGTSRIPEIISFSFNQNERDSNFQVSSRILRHSGLK